MKKIAAIENIIDSMSYTVVMSADVKFERQPLTQFAPTTRDEIRDQWLKFR